MAQGHWIMNPFIYTVDTVKGVFCLVMYVAFPFTSKEQKLYKDDVCDRKVHQSLPKPKWIEAIGNICIFIICYRILFYEIIVLHNDMVLRC